MPFVGWIALAALVWVGHGVVLTWSHNFFYGRVNSRRIADLFQLMHGVLLILPPFVWAKTSTGFVLAVLILTTSLTTAYLLKPEFLVVVSIYFVLNLAYSLKLKHVPLLDISIIAVGFVLRVVAGGVIPDIFVSHWILMMTFL